LPAEDSTTTAAVQRLTETIDEVNSNINNRFGEWARLPRPGLLPNAAKLLKDPEPPSFPLDDDEAAFIKLVSVSLSNPSVLTSS
jgi:hypothetical protein